MLDGFVTAIVAGPVSMDPRDWICPLLGVAGDAFDHGGTVEFAAISAVAVRHNVIANTLSTTPQDFAPIFGRKPNGDIDAGSWCSGFYAAIQLRPLGLGAALKLPISTTVCCCRSCSTASTTSGARCSDRPGMDRKPNSSGERPTRIFRPSSKRCVSTGCRHASRPVRSRRADVEARTAYV